MKAPKKHPESMDEVEEFKNFLGPAAQGYTDAQLRQLRREMYAMAELLLDIYLSGKQGRKDIDSHRSGAMLKAERSINELPLR
jgi:hypothetical protein